MRKSHLLIIPLIISVLMIFSCSKDSSSEKISSNASELKNRELFSKITRLANIENKKLAYSELSASERYSVWMSKFNYLLEGNDYTSEQKKCIVILKDKLSVELFHSGDAREIFKSVWLPQWIKNSKVCLTDIQIYNIAFTLDTPTNPNESVNSRITTSLQSFGSEGEFCHCAVNSNYTCLYSYLGQPRFGRCSLSGSCITAVRGCGALWDDDCDGNLCHG